MSARLSLKWGTLKEWNFNPDGPAMAAFRRYCEAGAVMAGAMMQDDNAAQVDAICEIIDALDADTIHLEWDGKAVSKEAAKVYVREYPR